MNIAVIGISTGGPRALRELFCDLPRLKLSVILVQHMPKFINLSVCRTIDALTDMQVQLAEPGAVLAHGVVHVAPSEVQLGVASNRHLRWAGRQKVNFVCPAVDVTMQSLHRRPGDRLVGVVMTGLGHDGAAGLAHMKIQGATTIVQDEATSTIYGMPKAAIATGAVDYQGSPGAIRNKLIELVASPEAVNSPASASVTLAG